MGNDEKEIVAAILSDVVEAVVVVELVVEDDETVVPIILPLLFRPGASSMIRCCSVCISNSICRFNSSFWLGFVGRVRFALSFRLDDIVPRLLLFPPPPLLRRFNDAGGLTMMISCFPLSLSFNINLLSRLSGLLCNTSTSLPFR